MRLLVLLALPLLAACGAADRDPAGGEPAAAATRIVTLAPHLAELVFAAGAGARLVGVSAYSDFPEDVLALPVVGDAFRIDHEQLALLNADLLLAWDSGTPAHIVESLRERGYRVELIPARSLDDIARALERIGDLTGRSAAARQMARQFEAQLKELETKWQDADPIRVFYQVSLRPLYTVNGEHYISQLITLCGGQNVFAELGELAPMISEEAVLERDPEVVMSAGSGGESTQNEWGFWESLAANRYANHFKVPANAIARPTPRVFTAGEAICERLQRGREQRAAAAT